MWRGLTYNGFQINVLAVPESNPPPGGSVPFGYTGYVNRPGSVIAVEANVRRFTHHAADYLDRVSAEEAAIVEASSIIDGTHPTLSVAGL